MGERKGRRGVGFGSSMVLCVLGLATGCATHRPAAPAVMRAAHATAPVRIDGVLDDPVWRTAQSCPLQLSLDNAGQSLAEGGRAWLAWDASNLYVAVTFEDSDIVAEGREDQLHHYSLGDLVEVFVKPADQTWYWELYATPPGRKTSFWFPGRGRLGLPSCFAYTCGLRVAATVDGTLNDWKDRDRSWSAELAIPAADLTAPGGGFGPGSAWRVMVSRYNYSRYLPHVELSMAPALSRTDYHRYEDYAILEFEP